MWIRRAIRHLFSLLAITLLGGLLGATLIRLAPGFGTDEREIDSRLRPESIQALREARAGERDIVLFYMVSLRRMLHGDLGVSRSFQQPVSTLLAQRVPVTFRSIGLGLLIGWSLALALAVATVLHRRPWWDVLSTFLSGAFLCLPAAVLGLLFLFVEGAVSLAIGLAVFPKVFRYVRNLLDEASTAPHVLTAKAKGLGPVRTLLWHVLPPVAPQILALAGVSVSLAFGAAIPIEVICDSPGVGQLAWQAAMSRDLNLLVNITLLVTLMTVAANSLSDLAADASTRGLA